MLFSRSSAIIHQSTYTSFNRGLFRISIQSGRFSSHVSKQRRFGENRLYTRCCAYRVIIKHHLIHIITNLSSAILMEPCQSNFPNTRNITNECDKHERTHISTGFPPVLVVATSPVWFVWKLWNSHAGLCACSLGNVISWFGWNCHHRCVFMSRTVSFPRSHRHSFPIFVVVR